MALGGYEKAALFLISLGEEVASEVLKGLDPQTVRELTIHMNRLRKVRKSQLDEVIKEASEIIEKGDIPVSGTDFLKNVLPRGLGEERARYILDMASKDSPSELFNGIEPKGLATILQNEHPQTAAMALSLMEPERAARVLGFFPERLRAEIALRVASIERIPEEAIEELREVLKVRLESIKGRGKELKGPKVLADILNYCDKTTEQIVFEKIEEHDTELADQVKEMLFVFEDLVNIDDRSIQLILKEVSTDDLAIALKTAPEVMKEKIFRNMSQRAAQILKDEMEAKGPVRVSDVEKAQKNIVSVARRLDKEGRIILGRGGEKIVV
ncbi:MAG: flagellar motor switch protein FliG [Thermodesulfovibrionales bacterium]|nr:flagellar motor switch protein FliG [Thermodesulfovibrionales bacterium]